MRIGFDIDDVLFPTTATILKKVRKLYPEKTMLFQDIESYAIEASFGLEKGSVTAQIDEVVLSINEPYKNAVNVIEELSIQSDIFFITSRPEHQFNRTLEILNSILCCDFYLESSPQKSIPVKYNNINIHVDDNPDMIKQIKEETSCKVIVYDKPWNRNVDADVVRAKNWKEIRELILNYMKWR